MNDEGVAPMKGRHLFGPIFTMVKRRGDEGSFEQFQFHIPIPKVVTRMRLSLGDHVVVFNTVQWTQGGYANDEECSNNEPDNNE